MSPVLRPCLPFGVAALVLSGLVPSGLPGTGIAPAFAQQPTAAEETEAETPRRRGRRGRDAAKATSGTSTAGTSTTGKTAPGKTAPGMQQATPVAIFGDWNVFASGQGKTRVCYAIAQPQARSPKTLKRDSAYLFVTVRKGENIQNEVAVMLGFPAKPPASQGGAAATPAPTDPTLNLGATRYALVVKGGNAWLQNQGEEPRVVTEMARTARLSIKATSMRGNPTNDDYALAGFNEAMKRTREECK